jgi:hypothetical protein
LGNCVEPSLVVEDRCDHLVYAINFNDCLSPMLDATGLTQGSRRPIGATMHGSTHAGSKVERAVAIRGTIDQTGFMTSVGTFDVEVDFPSGAAVRTVHLTGKTATE